MVVENRRTEIDDIISKIAQKKLISLTSWDPCDPMNPGQHFGKRRQEFGNLRQDKRKKEGRGGWGKKRKKEGGVGGGRKKSGRGWWGKERKKRGEGWVGDDVIEKIKK